MSRGFIASFLGAVFLHLSMIYVVYSIPKDPVQAVAEDKGKGGTLIGLGMQGSYQDILEPPKPKVVEKETEQPLKKESEPKVVEPIQKPTVVKQEKEKIAPQKIERKQEPKPVLKLVKPVKRVEKSIQVAEQAPLKEVVAEEVVVEAAVEATTQQKAVEEPEGEPQISEQKTEQKIAQKEKTLPQSNRTTGSENDRRSGSKKGNAKSYFSELMNWLNQHKEYPVELKKAKQQGTVEVQFTFSRNGQITLAKIKKSSGNTRLDNAALEMLKRANPLPAIPKSFGRDSLTIAIPVEYSLITNKS